MHLWSAGKPVPRFMPCACKSSACTLTQQRAYERTRRCAMPRALVQHGACLFSMSSVKPCSVRMQHSVLGYVLLPASCCVCSSSCACIPPVHLHHLMFPSYHYVSAPRCASSSPVHLHHLMFPSYHYVSAPRYASSSPVHLHHLMFPSYHYGPPRAVHPHHWCTSITSCFQATIMVRPALCIPITQCILITLCVTCVTCGSSSTQGACPVAALRNLHGLWVQGHMTCCWDAFKGTGVHDMLLGRVKGLSVLLLHWPTLVGSCMSCAALAASC